jgi:hypothetical protein
MLLTLTGFVALVVQIVAVVLALVFRRRLGTAATVCAALGFGLMIVQFLGTMVISFSGVATLERFLMINQLNLVALPLVVCAVFLGRRGPAPAAVPPAAGTFTIGAAQPYGPPPQPDAGPFAPGPVDPYRSAEPPR